MFSSIIALTIVRVDLACDDLRRICAISTHKLLQPSTRSFLQQSDVAQELAKQPIEFLVNENLNTIDSNDFYKDIFLFGLRYHNNELFISFIQPVSLQLCLTVEALTFFKNDLSPWCSSCKSCGWRRRAYRQKMFWGIVAAAKKYALQKPKLKQLYILRW